MGSYGRNFDFRVMPHGAQRGSRFMLSTATDVPIGAPVEYSGGVSTTAFGKGVIGVQLATGAEPPRPALDGILVYEWAPAAFAGFDPFLTNYSDLSTAPKGKLCQVVSGLTTKVVFTNTVATTFLQTRSYTGRIMVAGLGGSTSGGTEVGTYLTPGNGTDTAGYWQQTATAANAWLVVTAADQANLEVEAVMKF